MVLPRRSKRKDILCIRQGLNKNSKHAKKPTVYFIIDEEMLPNRCVKGKATVSISEDISKNLPIVEKMSLKYLGNLDNPDSKMFIDMTKNGETSVVEVTPKFYATWDMSGKPQNTETT